MLAGISCVAKTHGAKCGHDFPLHVPVVGGTEKGRKQEVGGGGKEARVRTNASAAHRSNNRLSLLYSETARGQRERSRTSWF